MISFSSIQRSRLMLLLAGLLVQDLQGSAAGGDEVYGPMNAAEVRLQLVDWAKERALPEATQAAIVSAWDGAPSTSIDAAAVLERAIRCWALGLPELATFLSDCQTQDPARLAALEVHTASSGQDPLVTNNLRSYLGRVYAEQRMYDEALTQLTAVDLEQAIDPAAVLFYRAVSSHEILEIPQAIAALEALQKQTAQVPPRYSTIAELMLAELEGLETQSLGEVARLMHDSERRLDLGRTGERVQGVQERIVSTLDELIKKIEAQQGGGGGGGSANGANQADAPSEDSRVKGATAPGETDDKTFKKEGRWGDLPEKQQTEAKNLINREFPSHYRQAIETYFKKLAGRPAPVDK